MNINVLTGDDLLSGGYDILSTRWIGFLPVQSNSSVKIKCFFDVSYCISDQHKKPIEE